MSVDKISKSHSGNRELFSGLSFSVSAGDRVAVIGPNGSGKSTLLRVVGGQDEATSGVVAKRRGLVGLPR